jgi:hypothetical protein
VREGYWLAQPPDVYPEGHAPTRYSLEARKSDSEIHVKGSGGGEEVHEEVGAVVSGGGGGGGVGRGCQRSEAVRPGDSSARSGVSGWGRTGGRRRRASVPSRDGAWAWLISPSFLAAALRFLCCFRLLPHDNKLVFALPYHI